MSAEWLWSCQRNLRCAPAILTSGQRIAANETRRHGAATQQHTSPQDRREPASAQRHASAAESETVGVPRRRGHRWSSILNTVTRENKLHMFRKPKRAACPCSLFGARGAPKKQKEKQKNTCRFEVRTANQEKPGDESPESRDAAGDEVLLGGAWVLGAYLILAP